MFELRKGASVCLLPFEGYEPKIARRAMPMVANPWWSERLKLEAELRQRRPEDLPVPDLEGDFDTDPVQDKDIGALRSGKGRGEAHPGGLNVSGLFDTPPSYRSGVEGRGGQSKVKKSEGAMPPSGEEGSRSGRGLTETMGPVPPTHPTQQDREARDGLQRALEAEMVILLQEQNAQLMAELERLRNPPAKTSLEPMSTPSSWETVDGVGGEVDGWWG